VWIRGIPGRRSRRSEGDVGDIKGRERKVKRKGG